jgi:hypothetical protein
LCVGVEKGEPKKQVCVTDAKSAIRWVKKNAAEFAIDSLRNSLPEEVVRAVILVRWLP